MAGSNQPLSFSAPQYPLDKIFYQPDVGSIAVAQSANPVSPTITTVSLNNPKGFNFFLDMQVSPDNGTTWYDSGLEPYYRDGVTLNIHKRFAGYWFMTDTTISLKFYANDASYTLSYRLIGYSIQ